MRIFIIPNSTEDWLILLGVLAGVIALGIGITVKQRFWPSATTKLIEDGRYQQALAIFADNLPAEEPTRDDRRVALAAATLYLVNEHGIDSGDAAQNMRLVVAAYDRDQSYELRNEALAYEEGGDHESALAYYERAARLQEDHDPKDYHVLLRCADRVRRKIRRE